MGLDWREGWRERWIDGWVEGGREEGNGVGGFEERMYAKIAWNFIIL